MRIVFIGAGQFSVIAARALLEDGHDVVIVDEDGDRLKDLEEVDLDCGLVHGDGSRPSVLKDLGPGNTDFLFCMSDSDQDNILAALAGEKLGFGRVVPMVQDPDFGGLCAQLGIEDVLVPSQEAANAVTDRVSGIQSVDLAPLLEAGLRFFSFAARESEAGSVGDLEIPDGVRILAVARDGKAELAGEDTKIAKGDRVYALCRRDRVETLRERFLGKS